MTSTLNLNEVLQRIFDHVRQVVAYDAASIFTLENDVLKTIASRGYEKYEPLDTQTYRFSDFPLWQESENTLFPVLIPDTLADPRWLVVPGGEWQRCYLQVPIFMENTLTGMLTIFSEQPAAFTELHREQLRTFGYYAGVAIRNAQLYEQEHQQRTLAEALVGSAAVLNSILRLDEVLDRILDEVGRVVSYDTAAIMLLEDKQLKTAGSRGYEKYDLAEWMKAFRPQPDTFPIWKTSLHEGQPVIVPDIQLAPDWIVIPETQWIRSFMSLPIKYGKRILGVLDLQSASITAFNNTHLERLQPFCHYAGIAIKNAQLYELEREQRSLAEALVSIASTLNSTLELDQVLERILDSVDKVVPYDAATVRLLEHDTFRVIGSRGYENHIDINPLEHAIFDVEDMPIWQRFLKLGQPYIVADTHADPNWVSFPETAWIRCSLSLPILQDGRVISILNLDSKTPEAFNENHLGQLLPFSHYAGTAIKNAQLFEQERDQRTFAEALISSVAALNSTLDPKEVLDLILENVERVVPHDAANVMYIENGVGRYVTHHGYEKYGVEDLVENLRFTITDFPILQVGIEQRKVIIISDTHTDPRWVVIDVRDDWRHSHIKAPIVLENEVIGFLQLDSTQPNHFTDAHATKLQAFTEQAGIALRNARLFAEEREQHSSAEALSNIRLAINSTLDPKEVLHLILENVERVVPHDAANVMLLEHGMARVVSHSGYEKLHLDREISGISLDVSQVPNMLMCVETKQPVIIGDIRSDPRWLFVNGLDEWLHSNLKAPIILDDEVIGFLNLDSSQVDYFTPEQAATLKDFTEQTATALKNARLFDQEHQQRIFAQALSDISAALNSTLDLEEVLNLILESLKAVVPHDAANITSIENGIGRVVSQRGYDKFGTSEHLQNIRQRIIDFPLEMEAIKSRQVIIVADTEKEPRWVQIEGTDEWLRSHMKAPIILDNEVIGFLHLDSAAPNHFTPDHAAKLKAFTDHAATALKNARLFTQEREQRVLAESLRESIAALNHSLDLDAVLDTLIEQIGKVLPMTEGVVINFIEEGGQMRVIRAKTTPPLPTAESFYGATKAIAGSVRVRLMMESRAPLLIRDTHASDLWDSQLMHDLDVVRSYLGVPLLNGATVIGFITAASTIPNAYDESHVPLLAVFAEPASAALRNAQLYTALERQRSQLQAVLDGTGESILYLEEQKIVFVNKATLALTGYPPEDLIGQPISILQARKRRSSQILRNLYPANEDDNNLLEEGQHVWRLRDKRRREFDVSATLTRLSPSHTVILMRDISQERKIQELQMRFITNASHELRHPLSSLTTRLYLMQKNPTDLEHHIALMETATQRLTTLVEHMSLMAEFYIGRVKLERRPNLLQDLLSAILKEAERRAAERQIRFTNRWQVPDTPLKMDSQLVFELMRLLLVNIILFTEEGGSISVTLATETKQEQAHLLIKLNAAPMNLSAEKLAQLFQPFGVPSEGEVIHSSLELSLVWHIIQLHSGQITTGNEPDGGVRFSIDLPL